MTERASQSFLVSLTLHVLVVFLIFAATYFAAQRAKDVPQIFELVAGPGDDMNSLEAPKLGNSSVKLDIPKVDLVPMVEDEPEASVQTPPQEAVVEPPPPTPPVIAEKPKPKTPEKSKPVEKPKVDNTIAKAVEKSRRVSYSDYLKKHPTPKPSKSTSTNSTGSGAKAGSKQRIDTAGIAGGLVNGSARSKSGSGGKALTREQADQMSTYISMLIQELKKAHQPPEGVSDRLETQVTFDITASGAIMNPRIKKSSGSKEFDDSVIEAFLRVRSIGPMPTRRPDSFTVTFRMRDDP